MKQNNYIFIVLFMMLSSPVLANHLINGIYYNIVEGTTAEVTYYKQNQPFYKGYITIPNRISYQGHQYEVTSIGDHAFASCRELRSVIIPNSVKQIGTNAFGYCI